MKNIIVGLGIAALLLGCEKPRSNETTAPPEKQSAPTVVEPQPSLNEKLEAILRGRSRMLKVCYDGQTEKGGDAFFVLFTDKDQITDFQGWFYVKDIPFYQTAAKTWFIAEIDDKAFIKVYPDVTGLDCKSQ